MEIHSKYRRYFSQAFTFALIWGIFGFIYIIVEKGILGDANFYPATDNRYDFGTSVLYAPLGGFMMGFIMGWIEVLWLKKKFITSPFWYKILFKGIFYLLLIIAFLIFLSFGINSTRYDAGPFDENVVNSVLQFFLDFAFWSLVIYIGAIVYLALFFSEIKDFVGGNIYHNYSLGKYHKPKKEIRIFMFLDMKSSTTIAERMGHAQYFKLIKIYYSDMTDAILETAGEIYQYVGDEIVVSWPEDKGLHNNNVLHCFLKIRQAINARGTEYKRDFGFIPEFKAGLHLGEVTTGEIGTLKKEIIYTGDVLNTAARIQALCNQYESQILISESLKTGLATDDVFQISEIGNLTLRGKSTPMPIYKVDLR